LLQQFFLDLLQIVAAQNLQANQATQLLSIVEHVISGRLLGVVNGGARYKLKHGCHSKIQLKKLLKTHQWSSFPLLYGYFFIFQCRAILLISNRHGVDLEYL